MPRAIWSGSISFGLVTVPVKLYSAVEQKTVRFHQLSGKTHNRISQRRVDSVTEEEVPYEGIVKGFEVEPEKYVILEPGELEALAPEKTSTIEIEDFVELSQIDPILYDKTYYLAPGKGGAKPYQLLLEAMRDTGKVAIARVVIRSREQLVAVRPVGEILVMETMLFSDEVRLPENLEEMRDSAAVKTTKREVDMAKQLVASLAVDFEPEKYRDTYREQILELINQKAEGQQVTAQPPAAKRTATPDLMSALKASLEEVKTREGSKAKPKRKASSPAPASGTAAKRKASSAAKKRVPAG